MRGYMATGSGRCRCLGSRYPAKMQNDVWEVSNGCASDLMNVQVAGFA